MKLSAHDIMTVTRQNAETQSPKILEVRTSTAMITPYTKLQKHRYHAMKNAEGGV